jgi:Putative amidase domain
MKLIKNCLISVIGLALSFSVMAGGSYNPNAAVSYATKWTSNSVKLRNPAYFDFQKDCTNFLSQNLRAGGLTDNKSIVNIVGLPLYNDIGNWYHIKSVGWGNSIASFSTFSSTWTLADNQYRRLKTGADGWKFIGEFDLMTTSNISVEYGDIVFAQWNPYFDKQINHSMLVTGFKVTPSGTKEPRFTYHAKDRLNISFSDFIKNIPDLMLGPKIYVFRRKTTTPVIASWQVF